MKAPNLCTYVTAFCCVLSAQADERGLLQSQYFESFERPFSIQDIKAAPGYGIEISSETQNIVRTV